jgi:alpha-1,2-mannosyltransferase
MAGNIDKKWIWKQLIIFCPPLIFGSYIVRWGQQFLIQHFPKAPPSDFLGFWLASYLSLAGMPSSVYNYFMFQAVGSAVSGTNFPNIWVYPPTFLLMVLPLAILPYTISMISWLIITMLGYIKVIRQIVPSHAIIMLSLAFPGTLLNIHYEQNGFLSAALFGGGMVILEKHPLKAGILLGLFSYKPQLSFLIPFALASGRHWQALGSAVATFMILVIASILILGWGTWEAFGKSITIATQMLGGGVDGLIQCKEKMVSIFPCAQVAGFTPHLALLLQVSVMVSVFALVIWIWLKELTIPMKATVLILSALMFTPHAFCYDLPLMSLAIAWLGWEGSVKGWLPGEQVVLLIAYCSPLIFFFATKVNIVMPIILMSLLYLSIRRVLIVPERIGTKALNLQ